MAGVSGQSSTEKAPVQFRSWRNFCITIMGAHATDGGVGITTAQVSRRTVNVAGIHVAPELGDMRIR